MAALDPRPRVLVVDDHEDTVVTVCALLMTTGAVPVGVHTGCQAIVMARVFLPTVVLLDLVLPDMSGFDVARAIRQFDQHSRILVVTGWAEPVARAIADGNEDIDGYFLKPVKVGELLALGLPRPLLK